MTTLIAKLEGLGVLGKLPLEIREQIYEEALEDYSLGEVVEVHSPCALRSILTLVSPKLNEEVAKVIARQKGRYCCHQEFYCDLTHVHTSKANLISTADLASNGKAHDLGNAEVLNICNNSDWQKVTRGGGFTFYPLSKRLGYFNEYIGADCVQGSQELKDSVEDWRRDCKADGEQRYLEDKALHLAKLISMFESDQEADDAQV